MKLMSFIVLSLLVSKVCGHQNEQQVTEQHQKGSTTAEVIYLGNTGLMIGQGEQQILFDPFFHSHFNHYQLVPEDIRTAIFADKAPYDSIEMILISHAHGDHFDASDVLAYLKSHPKTRLIAPSQVVEQLKIIEGFDSLLNPINGIDMVYGDEPIEMNFGEIEVGIVRIPHAGWPGRADVSNLVYRVTLNDELTVMHMGDADPNDVHFKPWANYWELQVTDNAYPPYWFLTSVKGRQILTERINAKHSTGVHVPVVVPDNLRYSGEEYFSEPGKVVQLIVEPKSKPE
jgi:L-ascorbate metabolism protein UlaG (beta-lactamase superfamily)